MFGHFISRDVKEQLCFFYGLVSPRSNSSKLLNPSVCCNHLRLHYSIQPFDIANLTKVAFADIEYGAAPPSLF